MDIEQKAFARLREGEMMSRQYYNKPLLICYSGGKDSDALVQLAINSGIKFEVLHNHTTADAPETVYHIRDTFRRLELRGIKCFVEYPMHKGKRTTMWDLIVYNKTPPTRLMRYCCRILKERGGRHRIISTGVRWSESHKRSSRGVYENDTHKAAQKIILQNDNDERRQLTESCIKQSRIFVNPIIDWKENDVWDYLSDNKTPFNPLYSEGFDRVGCIGCPMADKKRYAEFQRYPKYKRAYIRAFDRMVAARKKSGLDVWDSWRNGEAVFRWWLGEDPDQLKFEDL